MIWNGPRNVWWWLLLLSPAVVAIVADQTAQWWMPPRPPLHYTNGMVVANGLAHVLRIVPVMLLVIVTGSVIISVVLSHGVPFGQRVINTIFFALCLVVVNSSVAFAGCALLANSQR